MEVAQFLFAHGALVQSNRLSFIPPPVLDRYLDPAELEQGHTPTTVGAWSYRFKVVANNDDTKRNQRRPKSIQDPTYMHSPQTHATTDKTQHHTPAAVGVWCYLGDVSNGNASNEHTTDENAPSEWPREPHLPWRVLDLNPNEPLTPNPPNEHPVNEDPAS
ncbi:hypothetical protein BS47DRAFT_1365484 [Hydnum rufescens UP504]|uniref:Uncharacterized protein n=1 Tax=Hydnum rufescens UP504 TaxID=1448309 RepID=A0A9P6DNM6_9AGAM|nr:hypothetical protein BS47DRAFT_1365484 [Hydnum rufescens UP504]